MFQTLIVALPVFGFVAGGYILGKTPLFDAERAKGITNYVFWFAVPMLLFRAGAKLAGGEAAPFDPKVLIAYFAASAAIYISAMLANAIIFGGKGAEPPLAGMTAGYSNSVMMGIPLSELFFSADGLAIATAIIAMSAILYYSTTTLLIELRLHKSASVGGILKETALGLMRTPVILAMASGLLFGASGLHLHPVIENFVNIGAATATPTALFALGVSLAQFKIAGDLAEAGSSSALKLLLNPLIAWAIAGPVLGLTGLPLAAVTLMAALPCAINPFLLASRYQTYTRRASAAIVLSTGLSIITVTLAVGLVQ